MVRLDVQAKPQIATRSKDMGRSIEAGQMNRNVSYCIQNVNDNSDELDASLSSMTVAPVTPGLG